MEFISRKNIYHGDLAARNILLTDQLVAKVSDFGLSQRLYQCLTPNNPHAGNVGYMKLPIKWLALEVLMHGQATTKSDVWSYGVLVWEILHLGAEPYRPGKCTCHFVHLYVIFFEINCEHLFIISKIHTEISFQEYPMKSLKTNY